MPSYTTPHSEIELNNTRINATYLSLTEDPTGSRLLLGYGSGNQEPAVLYSNWSDPDYWRVELQAGDWVSVSVDTPDSDVTTYVELRNAAEGTMASSVDEGPGSDSFISRYGVTSTGSYYVVVGKDYNGTVSGSYQLHVDVARGIDQESDANYSNDSISGANVLILSAQGMQEIATVSGTIMGPEGRFDKDVFALGTLNAGNMLELGTRLSSTSTLSPLVTLLRADGVVVADEDGNAADGHFMATLSTDGQYYAQVTGGLVFGGHQYLMTDATMSWTAAEAYAQRLGGHLVTINDAAEQQWVAQNFSWAWVWTGFTDQAEENHWTWSSGAASGYSNWASEHPFSDNTDYSYAYMKPDGKWYTGGDSWSFCGLIEIEGAAPGVKGSGPEAKYLLDVNVSDLVPPRVEAVGLPSESATVHAPVGPSFTVTLSETLDAATVAASNAWDLREAGVDGVFGTTDDVIHRLELDGTYSLGTEVKLLIEDGSLGAGHYRFTANATLQDVVGHTLDGNGDGVGGDVYHRYFTIKVPDGVVFEGAANNTSLNATVLPLTEDPAGSGLLLGHGLGNQDPAVIYSYWSDPDYWRVELQAGDWVSVSVDTPDSNVDTYVELRNAADGILASSGDEGPGSDSFISRYGVTSSGSYYVVAGKDYNGTVSGSYQLHVDVARGIDQESDANYSNDSISGANVLSLSAQGMQEIATVSGTIMGSEGRFDKDVFALGTLSAGNAVEFGTRQPSTSTLSPQVKLLRADGSVVVDEDGNAADGHFMATLSTDGQYYAQVTGGLVFGGHQYLMTDAAMSWTAAEANAQRLGGHLVTINDAAEQQWVAQNFSWAWVWTGFTDQAEENHWTWSSGAASDYTNWALGHPNSDNTYYSYAYMKPDGKWYSGGESWDFWGLIEIEGAAPGVKGSGPEAKYLLDVKVSDLVPPRVEAVGLPSESATVHAPVWPSFTVTLSETMDAATVAASNAWDLREAGVDGVFDTADDVIHRMVQDGTYTLGTQVTLLIEDGALSAGHYRFTANATLKDVVGNTLDGNGDGVGGDVYHRYFTIEVPNGVVFEGAANNTSLNATVLPLTEDPAGSGLLLGHGLGNQDPAVISSYWSDPDYWRVELQAGDWVSVTVDTPDSDVDSYLELRNAADGGLTGSNDEGTGTDAFLSRYGVTVSGSYYVVVGKDYYSTASGSYQLHVEVARGIDQEFDANYSNDSISGATVLSLSAQGTHQIATVAGTVIGQDGRFDRDVFALGTLNAGNMVELGTRLPSTSSLLPLVMLLRADGTVVADEDGNAADGHVLATLVADGEYYAKVESEWTYGGHQYLMTDAAMSWTAAEVYAQSMGGHLVTIDDAAEQEWVAQNFSLAWIWTGFTDQAEENHWMWSSGAASGYTNWASGHPNIENTDYRYAYMKPDGKWYTGGDSWSFCGLIEIEGAASGVKGFGQEAKYLLDVNVSDLVPPRIVAANLPSAGATVSMPIGPSFTVTLSETLDASTVAASNAWDLREAGVDGVFDTTDDVIHRLEPDGTYSLGTEVKLLIEDGSLGAGHYRFTANATLKDVVGHALDGNGDGVGGDAYNRYFTIEVPYGVVFEGGANNTALNATVLPLSEDPAGSGLLLAHGLGNQYPAVLYSNWSDPDYWRVELQAGDRVTVSVDTPDSNVDTYVELRNAADGILARSGDEGPGIDAHISRYGVTSSGSYYVVAGKDYYSTVSGSYQLHVDVARGVDQESDANNSNDSISGANVLSFSVQGTHQIATVAGTVTGQDGRCDKDVFALGTLNASNVVELGTRQPSTSTLSPLVMLLRADGMVVADEDGNVADGHVMATLSTDGQYYAQVTGGLVFSGHQYLMTDAAMSWTAAEAYAQRLGGHLVTIDNAAEQAWVAQNFSLAWIWTGFTDQAEENHWMWSSGVASDYTNWASGHPNIENTYYSYAYMKPDGKWYSGGESWDFWGLIEIEGAAPGVNGSGPEAKYLLDVNVSDQVPPRVEAVGLPSESATVHAPVGPSFTVTLSETLDAATVAASNAWDLREAGVDGDFDTADDVIHPMVQDGTYTLGTQVKLVIEDGSLGAGHYRFTANATLQDIVGHVMDGNGDGVGGDAYRRYFTIDVPNGVVFEKGHNNTIVNATYLPLTEDPAGSGLLLGRGLGNQDPAVINSYWSDPDYWRVDLQAGDWVSVSIDTPYSDVNPYVELRNAADGTLVYGYDEGPGTDEFISRYGVTVSGSYYVVAGKDYYSSVSGSYQLRVDVARGIDQESDTNYSNNSIGGANVLNFASQGSLIATTIAGTIMSSCDGQVDEDTYNLGHIAAGQSVLFGVRLPDQSALRPIVEIYTVDGSLVSIAPNPTSGYVQFDVITPDTYFARVLAFSGEGTRGQYLLEVSQTVYADLEVTIVVASEFVRIGQPFSLQWRVNNSSNALGTTQVTNWYDSVVVSSDDVIGNGDDIVLGSFAHHGSLEKGSSYIASATVTIPQAASWPLKLFVTTDSSNTVYEFNYELNNSSALIPLNNLNQQTGSVTFWKTGDPITGVTSTLTSVPAADGTQLVEFRNIQVAADGGRTMEIWETSTKNNIGTVHLELSLSDGSVATWQNGASLPTGWSWSADTDKPGALILQGEGITALSVGPVKLGILSLTAPTNLQHFNLSLSSGQLGNDTVPSSSITSDSMTTAADGFYHHIDIPDGTYALTSTKVVDTVENTTTKNAVDLLDAITILKSIVGLTTLNTFQEIAADFDNSKGVDLNDAIGILKHVVGLPSPTPEWVFVNQAADPVAPIIVDVTADITVDLVGILRGDVDGNWAA